MDQLTQHYITKYDNASTRSARMTGSIEAMAKYYPDELSARMRIKLLDILIEAYTSTDEQSDLHQEWIKKWNKLKNDIALESIKKSK
jgi:hypothetical protein